MSPEVDIKRLLADLEVVMDDRNKGVCFTTVNFMQELCTRSHAVINHLQAKHRDDRDVLGRFLIKAGNMIMESQE